MGIIWGILFVLNLVFGAFCVAFNYPLGMAIAFIVFVVFAFCELSTPYDGPSNYI